MIKSQLLFLITFLFKGYENLGRIIRENPDGSPIASPNNFDHACFTKMQNEFWGPSSNYFTYLFQIKCGIFYLIYLHCLFVI